MLDAHHTLSTETRLVTMAMSDQMTIIIILRQPTSPALKFSSNILFNWYGLTVHVTSSEEKRHWNGNRADVTFLAHVIINAEFVYSYTNTWYLQTAG